MEHRWNAREPYQCKVTLRCPRIGSLPGKTRDLSWGGMFIETAGLALPPNSFIEVTCHLGGDEPRRRLRMRGLVVHRAPDGAGVMFLETADEAVRALRAALYEKPKARARPRRELLWTEPRAMHQPQSQIAAAGSESRLYRAANSWRIYYRKVCCLIACYLPGASASTSDRRLTQIYFRDERRYTRIL